VPKTGPGEPTTDEWKQALKFRLEDELDWSHEDLANRVGLSRAAISHILKKGIYSAYVHKINAAVGWKTDEDWKRCYEKSKKKHAEAESQKRQHVDEAKSKLLGPEEAKTEVKVIAGDAGGPDRGSASEVVELLAFFNELRPESRARVLERARLLWEDERSR